MRQLRDRLWWVDEVAPGAGVYVWQDAEGLILFDTGMPWHARSILSALSAEGFTPSQIHHILITHGDLDHIGGMRAIKQATGAPIVCHAVTGAILQGRLRRPLGLGLLGKMANLPIHLLLGPIFHCIPTEADELIVDGTSLPGGFQAVFTPGHCPGHTAYYHPDARVLIAGDVVRNAGRELAPQPSFFTADPAAAIRDIERLARLEVETLCLGHGEPILTGAQAQLQALAQKLQQTSP